MKDFGQHLALFISLSAISNSKRSKLAPKRFIERDQTPNVPGVGLHSPQGPAPRSVRASHWLRGEPIASRLLARGRQPLYTERGMRGRLLSAMNLG